MSNDPFSDILEFTNAASIVTGGFSAGGDWALQFPAPDKIKFFAIVKGNCWVRIEGERDPMQFRTGDVGMLTVKRSFILSSDLTTSPLDAMSVFSRARTTTATLGDGKEFTHLGGHVLLDPVSGQLLKDALPPWIHIPAASPQAKTFRWLLDQLVEERESDLPGTQLVSAQLSQLLFIQILRAYQEISSQLSSGWLKAMVDPRIAPALRLMHTDPAHCWQLEELAKACAMSRTTFSFHFKKVAGVPPLTYLTNWRMNLAERALREEITLVAVIARSLGYTSESAFSNAFKRIFGQSPKAYRIAKRIHN